jgi:hypothetical protein
MVHHRPEAEQFFEIVDRASRGAAPPALTKQAPECCSSGRG